jgi:hypothetical protein
MDLEKALRRYREDRFTDEDIERSTGLSERAWRELIKLGVVRTIAERRGPGRIRLCDATTFKRGAVIAAVNKAGLSLAVSARIAYFLPFHTLLYSVCDPSVILLQHSAHLDPDTGLPPRLEQPKVNWFDPAKRADADVESDWFVEIYDGRFVGVIYKPRDKATIFGDLREERTRFVAWVPLHRRAHLIGSVIEELARELLSDRFVDFVAEWEDPTIWSKELSRLGYEFEKHDPNNDPLRITAEAASRGPVFKTTINISLTLRKALRRLLGIDPAGTRALK